MPLTHSHKLTIPMNIPVRDQVIRKEKEKKIIIKKNQCKTSDLHFSPKALCFYMLKTTSVIPQYLLQKTIFGHVDNINICMTDTKFFQFINFCF